MIKEPRGRKCMSLNSEKYGNLFHRHNVGWTDTVKLDPAHHLLQQCSLLHHSNRSTHSQASHAASLTRLHLAPNSATDKLIACWVGVRLCPRTGAIGICYSQRGFIIRTCSIFGCQFVGCSRVEVSARGWRGRIEVIPGVVEELVAVGCGEVVKDGRSSGS